MKKYNMFFGIDVAKKDFVVATCGSKSTKTYPNTPEGFQLFILQNKLQLKNALVVLETTGCYEWNLMSSLVSEGISVHRADTVKVKNYIRSLRRFGKTDAIDAHGLATYAFERHATLKLFQKPQEAQLKLQLLVRRRDEVVEMRVQEINRSKSPMNGFMGSTFKDIIRALDKAIVKLEAKIEKIITSDPTYKVKKEIMTSMPGIGEQTANKLLALMPELGHATRRGIANLSGVAPHPRDSGGIRGYRKTCGGRQDVKKALFMAALSASRSKGRLGTFYQELVSRGKKKMVAMVALMRKMIVIINAKIRDYLREEMMISTLPV